jgi:hypothetical protein
LRRSASCRGADVNVDRRAKSTGRATLPSIITPNVAHAALLTRSDDVAAPAALRALPSMPPLTFA